MFTTNTSRRLAVVEENQALLTSLLSSHQTLLLAFAKDINELRKTNRTAKVAVKPKRRPGPHNLRKTQCDVCGKSFRGPIGVATHKRLGHG